ncbi:MAG TPA: S49 family peptidase [Pirellulales bacterium]|nr:S49 family peptidase [Pirellulales bacterium]
MKRRKRYRSIAAAVYGTVWAINPDKLAQICQLLEERGRGVRLSKEEIRQRIGVAARPANATIQQGQGNKIAVLNLFGVVAQRMSLMEQISGGTSTEQFAKAFDAALNDADVKAIVINVDSPGGSVHGVEELAQKIFEARGRKPVKAIANAQMDSAAYWIGSAADEVLSTPSGVLGSVGAVAIHTEQSKLDDKAGLKRTILTSARYKAEGNPYEPLSETAKEYFEGRVRQFGQKFVETVARNRGVTAARVEADYGQGRELTARDALAAGMIDRIATLEQLLSEFGVASGANTTTAAAQPPAFSLENVSMNKRIFEALVRMGLCSIDAAQDVATAALAVALKVKGFAGKHDDVEAVLAALGVQDASPVQAAATAAAARISIAGEQMTAEDILAAVRLAPLPDDRKLALQGELMGARRELNVGEVLGRINKAAAEFNKPLGATSIEQGAAAVDKFQVEARDALLCREFGANLPEQIYDVHSQDVVDWKPAAGARRAGHMASLPQLARQCMIIAGIPQQAVDRLQPSDIARIMVGAPLRQFGIAASVGPAFNVSGMFSNILLDAQNITLRRSYMEAKTTFQVWMRQAESIIDFKPVNRVILGELGDPKAVPEDGEFEETTATDGKESYKLTVWGQVFSITWQAIVNDRLQAFTRIPTMEGQAMKRKQNKLAYGVLLDNANLSDGIALFDANSIATPGHNNLATGAATPTVATLNTQYKKMSEMPGLNTGSNTVLNLQPRYIVTCPALRGTVYQLLNSTADPASTNAGVANIWENALQPVIDAQLGAAAGGSDTAWYLAADFNDVDTIEFAYLQGLESPALEQEVAFDRLALRYRIYQAFAVKAIDFRGLQKHAGA